MKAVEPVAEPSFELPSFKDLKAKKRWSREDWVDYGLITLEEGGLAAVRVDDMAKRSGRTRGSFYGYFRSRDELLDAMVEKFRRLRFETTEAGHAALKGQGRFTLSGLVDRVQERGGGELRWFLNLELAMRLWARSDPRPRNALSEVDRFRLLNAEVMARNETGRQKNALELAIIFNVMLIGRSLVFIKPGDTRLQNAFARISPAFIELCVEPTRRRRRRS